MSKNILVIVDVQDSSADNEVPIIEKLRKLLDIQLFDEVIATEFVNDPNSPFSRIMGFDGSSEAYIPEKIVPYVTKVVSKSVYCDMNSLLNALIECNGGEFIPDRVYIAGMDTDACILSTAMQLFDCNIRPVVLSEYCWSSGGKAFHDMGIRLLKRNIGANNVF